MEQLHIQVIRSARRTLCLEVKPDGSVIARVPNRTSRSQLDDFLQKKTAWLQAQLQRVRQTEAQPKLTAQELAVLRKRAGEIIPTRVSVLSQQVGVTYGRVTVRTQHTRWGSCSAKGNLNFNCLLLLCPPEVMDYVLYHELCHRKQMNHSPRFWAEVERVCPRYREARQWLKQNGTALIERGR